MRRKTVQRDLVTLFVFTLATCNAAPRFSEANCTASMTVNSAQLTFLFSSDIRELPKMRGFEIQFRRTHDSESGPDTVVSCILFSDFQCFVQPGLNCTTCRNAHVSVSVLISNYTEEHHAGVYSFHPKTTHGNGYVQCVLPPAGGKEPHAMNTTAAITNYVKTEKDTLCEYCYTTMLALQSTVLIFVIVTLAFWLWNQRKSVGVCRDRHNTPPTSTVVSYSNLHARNDAELDQRFSKMEQEIKKIPERVYQMTTDTTVIVLKQLQNLLAKLDNNKRPAREESVSDYEDETLHKSEVTDPLLSQPSSSKSPLTTPRQTLNLFI